MHMAGIQQVLFIVMNVRLCHLFWEAKVLRLLYIQTCTGVNTHFNYKQFNTSTAKTTDGLTSIITTKTLAVT